MQRVRVRNIFSVNVPFTCPSGFKVQTLNPPNTFGFELQDNTSTHTHVYYIELRAIKNGQTKPIANWASWGGHPISVKHDESTGIQGIILHIRINHGIFDFRTLGGAQTARISVNYFVDGVFMQRGVSQAFQILPKPRSGFTPQRK